MCEEHQFESGATRPFPAVSPTRAIQAKFPQSRLQYSVSGPFLDIRYVFSRVPILDDLESAGHIYTNEQYNIDFQTLYDNMK